MSYGFCEILTQYLCNEYFIKPRYEDYKKFYRNPLKSVLLIFFQFLYNFAPSAKDIRDSFVCINTSSFTNKINSVTDYCY